MNREASKQKWAVPPVVGGTIAALILGTAVAVILRPPAGASPTEAAYVCESPSPTAPSGSPSAAPTATATVAPTATVMPTATVAPTPELPAPTGVAPTGTDPTGTVPTGAPVEPPVPPVPPVPVRVRETPDPSLSASVAASASASVAASASASASASVSASASASVSASVAASASACANPGEMIAYEVTGDGPANLTYTDLNYEVITELGVALPWRVGYPSAGMLMKVYAQRTEGSVGTISCKLWYNGVVVSEDTQDGPNAQVGCFI